MSILKFKPNNIQTWRDGGTHINERGQLVAESGEWVDAEQCDAVPAGAANQITLDDGKVYSYSFVIFLEPEGKEYRAGDKIKIERYGVTFEKIVIGFQRYQMQRKIWV